MSPGVLDAWHTDSFVYACLFSARTSGLCAHVIEQDSNNRLFRPRVSYMGPRHQAES